MCNVELKQGTYNSSHEIYKDNIFLSYCMDVDEINI